MRGQKTFTIEGHEKAITVYELTVKQILGIFNVKPTDSSLPAIGKHVEASFLDIASTLKQADMEVFTPSEIEYVWTQFREVNAAFFRIAQTVGLDQFVTNMLDGVRRKILATSGGSFADSSREVISELADMGTLISSMPSTNPKK